MSAKPAGMHEGTRGAVLNAMTARPLKSVVAAAKDPSDRELLVPAGVLALGVGSLVVTQIDARRRKQQRFFPMPDRRFWPTALRQAAHSMISFGLLGIAKVGFRRLLGLSPPQPRRASK